MTLTEKEKSQLMGEPMDATRRGGCLNVFVVLSISFSANSVIKS